MSFLEIIYSLPSEYKLLCTLNEYLNIYNNKTDYICSGIVPWYDPDKTLYVKITNLNEEVIDIRLKPPLGFTFDEICTISDMVCNLCNSLSDSIIMDRILPGLQIEHILMPFISNSIFIYMIDNNQQDRVLYAIAQVLYVSFGIAQDRLVSKLKQ